MITPQTRSGRPVHPYLNEVECLRGLAISLVFAYHAWGISFGEGDSSTPLPLVFFAAGQTGVTLFFVLSGFLLSLPWLRWAKEKSETKPNIRSYYGARSLRILPLYFLWVLLAAVLTGEWSNALKAFTFQFIGFDMFPYGVVWWTLTTEVQFYLVLPFVWWAWITGGWYRFFLYLGLLLWLSAYLAVFEFGIVQQPAFSYWVTKSLFGRLPAFLIGMLCAAVFFGPFYESKSSFFQKNRLASTVGFFAILLALSLILQRTLNESDWITESKWHLHHTYEAILWGCLLLLLLASKPLFHQILVNPVMALVGKLSYSIYLSHVAILYFMIDGVREMIGKEIYPDSLTAIYLPLVALLATLVLSMLTYRYIERPFLNLKKKLAR